MAPHHLIDNNVSDKSAASVFSISTPRFVRARASYRWYLSTELYGVVFQKAVPLHTRSRRETQIPQPTLLNVLQL